MDQMYRPKTTGWQGSKKLMHGAVSKYYTDEWDKESGRFKLKEGYSHVAHQDAPDALASMKDRRTKKGGGFEYGDEVNIYKKVDTSTAAQAAPQETEEPKEEMPVGETNPSIGDTAKGGISDGVKGAIKRVGVYEAEATDGTMSERVYGRNPISDEDNENYAQSRAFDFLRNYKMDLKENYDDKKGA